jgi:tRNA threonylcarbamoyladenosine biosynthesis protein TsaB
VLVLAFDTATEVATSALVRLPDGECLGERASRPLQILEDVDGLLADAGLGRDSLEGVVVGTGPGSYTGLRIGLMTARALSFALDVPVAGVSTLAALAAGAPGARPVLDGKRAEIFTLGAEGPVVVSAQDLRVERGAVYVGDGALRYREPIEQQGGEVPADDDPSHVPWARHHAALAQKFGPAEAAEPIYLRLPDAERALSG